MCICLDIFVILTMVHLLPALPTTVVNKGDDDFSVVHYLVKYGHLEDKLDVRSYFRSQKDKKTTMDPFHPYNDEEIKNAIKSFQISFHLKPTGYLDDESMNVMQTPRCGVADKGDISSIQITIHRRRRFTKQGSKWPSTTVTWTIYRYHQSNVLSRATQKLILKNAFDVWEYASSLKFAFTPDTKKADIIIQFVSRYHGHKPDFDGTGSVLAHASFPYYGGDIHFDADEKWGSDFNLLNVAVHEIGHSIGLKHSNIYNSMMYPSYRVRKSIGLDDDDKAGVNAIYGQCETKLDGAASVWGSNFFFRGNLVWKINEYDSKVVTGYPKKISEEFSSRVATPIDTALIWSDDNIYFLHNTASIAYDIYLKSVKYDNTIQFDWPGIPNYIDAAISYIEDSLTYFFKGSQYWKFNDILFQVETGYPKQISVDWRGIPDNIDAAYYSVWNKKTYFFKDTQYWEFDKVTNQGVPQGAIKNKWKNVCSAKY